MGALDIINIDVPFVTELEGAFSFFFAKGFCLVDLGIFGEFSINLDWKN